MRDTRFSCFPRATRVTGVVSVIFKDSLKLVELGKDKDSRHKHELLIRVTKLVAS
jgi:hypothetical protein